MWCIIRLSVGQVAAYMKILTVSATDHIGGAAIAAYRLHQGLLGAGIEAEMLVMRKVTADSSVHRLSSGLHRYRRMQRRLAERRHQSQLGRHPRQPGSGYWSLNRFGYPIAKAVNVFEADVVHLHWVGDNYLPIPQFAKIKAPIVWTLHDMWAFTGGCHSADDCLNYRENCGSCPQLRHPAADDISARILRQKRRAWANLPMTIVCPSQWLADCARQSRVLKNRRIEVIPNGIDPSQFKRLDKGSARQAFNLPLDKKLILFGAVGGTEDPRKGFAYLWDALRLLPEKSDIELVVFGAAQAEALELHLPLHQVGYLGDSVSMTLLYSACDVLVLPALQENLPNTLMESLACGTPCVAFNQGGTPELIQHQHNGYLARFKDRADLAKGIQWVLAGSLSPQSIHQQALDRYHIGHIAKQYIRLYQSLG